MPNFVLVDDHPIVLSGLAALLRAHPRYQIANTATTAEAALNLGRDLACDILVADLHLLGERFELLRRLRAERPELRIMIFTETTGPNICHDVLQAGANGIVLKDSSPEDLIAAIETVLSGKEFISQPLAAGVSRERELEKKRRQQLASIALSARENQVAHELLNGASNKDIAVKLNISLKTVKFYMNQIMRKFDVRNRVEVVLEMQRMNNTAPTSRQPPPQHPTPTGHSPAPGSPTPPRPTRSRLQ